MLLSLFFVIDSIFYSDFPIKTAGTIQTAFVDYWTVVFSSDFLTVR